MDPKVSPALSHIPFFVVFFMAVTDESLIRRTLALAARARGRTSPNPMVGALVLKNGKIISEGYHKKAGTAHAEVIAIDRAGDEARGSTLYVSLEPCCHRDKRTPPCTDKIISSGIRRVVIAMSDPNPKVAGKGTEELRKNGIEVVSGVLENEARRLNEYYIKYISTRRPFVIMKVAMTLDGKIATPEGESKWITGEKARREVQRLRCGVDAIISAAGTVAADDPQLTCRTIKGRSPLRVIVDPRLDIGHMMKVFSVPPPTVVATCRPGIDRADAKEVLSERGIDIIEHVGERVDLRRLMAELGRRGIMSVMVEAGSSFTSSCLESGIVDKVFFFIAPKIIGGKSSFPAIGGESFRRLSEAYRVREMRARRVGEDILIEGYIEYP